MFADAPHLQGNLVFRDFYDQFKETLKFVLNNFEKKKYILDFKNSSNKFLYNEESVYKELIDTYKFKNLIDCPKNINSQDLISICDNVITSKRLNWIRVCC